MANYDRTTTYTHWDDCDMAGCAGHTAELKYQSTSDNLLFTLSDTNSISLDPNQLDALIQLLHEIEPVYIHKIFKKEA